MFSFGKEDNILKVWNVNDSSSKYKITINPDYLELKSDFVRYYYKVNEANFISEEE